MCSVKTEIGYWIFALFLGRRFAFCKWINWGTKGLRKLFRVSSCQTGDLEQGHRVSRGNQHIRAYCVGASVLYVACAWFSQVITFWGKIRLRCFSILVIAQFDLPRIAQAMILLPPGSTELNLPSGVAPEWQLWFVPLGAHCVPR